jgi:hypothetical protein
MHGLHPVSSASGNAGRARRDRRRGVARDGRGERVVLNLDPQQPDGGRLHRWHRHDDGGHVRESTNITVSITLYRTAKAGATAASSGDHVVKTASATYATVKGTSASKVLTATQKCLTMATVAYGYYTKATMTNGTAAGTVSQNSSIVQLKGCITV